MSIYISKSGLISLWDIFCQTLSVAHALFHSIVVRSSIQPTILSYFKINGVRNKQHEFWFASLYASLAINCMVYFKLKTSDWYPWLFYRVFLVQISIHTLCLSFMILRFLSNRQNQSKSKDELHQCEIHRQVVRRHMHCIWNTNVAAWLHLGNNLVRIFWACSIWQSWPAHWYGLGWWPINSLQRPVIHLSVSMSWRHGFVTVSRSFDMYVYPIELAALKKCITRISKCHDYHTKGKLFGQ